MPRGTIAISIISIIFAWSSQAYGQDSTNVDSTKSGYPQNLQADFSSEDSKVEKFRKAFEKIIEQEYANKQTQNTTNAEEDPSLSLEGFVLDETRSKMGRDFYALFYQKWEAPENASNYTITITEKPTLGRGSQVTIKIDYENAFSARLQPRYEYIDALSEQAVARCQQIIQQQASVKQQLMGY